MNLRFTFLYIVLSALAFDAFSQTSVDFIENKGQWGSWFRYRAMTKGGDVLLENDGFRYILSDQDNNLRMDFYEHGKTKVRPVLKFHCYKMTFEGASLPQITGSQPQKMYYNYFHGNDSSMWRGGIHPYRSLDYTGIYQGIDVHLYSDKGSMMYDFIVAPQADASAIKMKFEGQDDISIEKHDLVVTTSVGSVKETRPIAYQYINGERVEVRCEYRLARGEVTFRFPDDYDHSQKLFIDPTVVFCTMTGSTADNWGFTATYDDAGDFYNGGLVNTLYFGGHYPVSPGAFQTTFGGGYSGSTDSTYASDIAIIKYDPTGVNRIFATYLGGSGNERPFSMIVDPNNELIVVGRTRSQDYPVTTGAFQTVNKGGWDICITKFNAAGSALVGSTYLGGSGDDGVNFDSTELAFGELKFNYGDDGRSEVQVDNAGNIYVAGSTKSTDFPTLNAISTTLSGDQDGIVCKFNSTLTTMLWGTYLGGNAADAAYVLAFDTSQQYVYVAGGTSSTDFPTTAGTLNSTFQGGRADGFVVKFKNSGAYNLLAGTYIGTPNYDQVYGIQVSDDNYVYVMGQSLGGSFPVTAGVYSNPNSCQFAMKMDLGLTTDLISTVFGNGNRDSTNISPVAFLVDTCGNVYISGWGGDLGLSSPTEATGTAVGMPTTSDAIRATSPLGRDFYFIVLGPGMATLRYATYYGRNCPLEEWEGCHVDGGTSRFDKSGVIYQAMCADCGGAPGVASYSCPDPFPTTSGVWSMVDSSANCNEAALKIAFQIGPVSASAVAGPNTSGCAPLTVNFTNLSVNGLTYVWNFGDGSTTTAFSPTHTFVGAGVYTVSLAATNSNACFKVADTAYLIIAVDTNTMTPNFTSAITDSCGPYVASFVNNSSDFAGTPTYQWWFGDGGTYTGTTPTNHTYTDTGTYTITMVMTDTAACKSPDTLTQIINITSVRLAAKYSIPDSVCLGTPISPTVNFSNVDSTSWTFGDGTTSTGNDPTHMYGTVGTYTVTLIAVNTGACNGADTLTESITVLPVPNANFSYTPTTPQPNTPTTFTNLSTNATHYLWNFGDDSTSTDVNPVHQYNKTGTYKVCLNAYNASNCPSMACKLVPTDVEPLVGIPTAFSPNGDGNNDVLYVHGAAIATMDLKIFNRWGQLVFESTSLEKGWDGTFNGEPQPIEAYAYVLSVTFIDGTSKVMKGNITLLR